MVVLVVAAELDQMVLAEPEGQVTHLPHLQTVETERQQILSKEEMAAQEIIILQTLTLI
jgi:hypothetical protein